MLLKENAIRKEKEVNGKNRYYLYIFKCNDCDKELRVSGGSLKTHSGKCRRCTQLKTPYLYIYNELKGHRRKDVDFTITFEEFTEKIKNNYCHYCDDTLIFEKNSRNWGETNSRSHKLDRKNNDLGYTNDNTVCCCWDCNRLKSNRYSYDEFLLFSPILKKIRTDRKNKIRLQPNNS